MLLHARTSRCNLRPTSETPAGRGGCPSASAPRYSGEPDDTNRRAVRSLLFVRVHGSARLMFVPAGRHRVSRLAPERPRMGQPLREEGSQPVCKSGHGWPRRSSWRDRLSCSVVWPGHRKPAPTRPRPGAQDQNPGTPKTQDSQNPSVQEKRPTANTQTVELSLIDCRPGPGWLRGRDQAGEPKHSLPAATPARRVAGQGEIRVP